jgi:hypothetical protein
MTTENDVSGTGHKKRDWKAINARRPIAIAAKSMHISRYQVDEIRRIQKWVGDEFQDRLMSAELTIPQVRKIIDDRGLSSLSEEDRKMVLGDRAHRDIRKHWRCIAKALRQLGVPEDKLLNRAITIISQIIQADKERAWNQTQGGEAE